MMPEYLLKSLSRLELRLLAYLALVILANHFWK
jgi:hypothetical protein